MSVAPTKSLGPDGRACASGTGAARDRELTTGARRSAHTSQTEWFGPGDTHQARGWACTFGRCPPSNSSFPVFLLHLVCELQLSTTACRPRISALLLTLCNPPVPQTMVTTEHEAWIPPQLLGPHVCAVSRGCLVSESPVPSNTTWGSPRVKKSIGLGKLQLGSRYIHKGGQSHIQRNPNPNKEGFLPLQVSVAEGENKTQNCWS